MLNSPIILEFNGISHKKNTTYLFKNLCASLHPSHTLYIEGKNGQGKTTLIKTLLGFIPLQSGSIIYKNNPIKDVLKDFYNNIIYIGHENALIPELTVLENMHFFGCLAHQKITHQKITKALHDFRLTACKDRKISVLSQGQKKRLTLSKLILLQKNIWVLDEPFDALDTYGKTYMCDLLLSHILLKGITIFTSHIVMPWENMNLIKIALTE